MEILKAIIITTQWKGEKPRDKDSGAEEKNSNKQWGQSIHLCGGTTSKETSSSMCPVPSDHK